MRLPLSLQYLSMQKTFKGLAWELIIVDNNSDDHTSEVAENAWRLFDVNTPIRLIHEAKPGLSFARITGVNTAKYDIIIFCDDDNLLDRNYLQLAFDIVNRTINRGYGIWGGKTIAFFDDTTKVPAWFENEKANYVVGKQGLSSGDISNRGYVWGAGMIILKHLFLQVTDYKYPLLLTGRESYNLTSGDDSEICLRSLIMGYKLYYDELLILKHYISEDKLTQEYNFRLKQGFLHAHPLLNKYSLFVHYISGQGFLKRLYYTGIYSVKYFLSIFQLRKLTLHDTLVIHALFPVRFNDHDFWLMHELLKQRLKPSP